jgi:hypothetical protein
MVKYAAFKSEKLTQINFKRCIDQLLFVFHLEWRKMRVKISIDQKLLDRDAGAGCAVCYLVRYAAKKQAFKIVQPARTHNHAVNVFLVDAFQNSIGRITNLKTSVDIFQAISFCTTPCPVNNMVAYLDQ